MAKWWKRNESDNDVNLIDQALAFFDNKTHNEVDETCQLGQYEMIKDKKCKKLATHGFPERSPTSVLTVP